MGGVAGEKQPSRLHRLGDVAAHRRNALLQDLAALERPHAAEPRFELVPDALVGPSVNVLLRRALHIEPRHARPAHGEQRKAALVEAVDQLFVRRRRFTQDAEPAERIDAVVAGQHAGREARPADAVKPVAATDEVALDLLRPALMAKADLRAAAVEVVDAGVRDLEENFAAVGKPLGDQIGDDLLLVVDEHLLADQLVEVDVPRLALAGDVDAVMHHGLALEPGADTGVHQHVRDPMLHQAGAHARLAIGPAAVLDDDAGNAGEVQQMRQHQPGRSRSDDADLGAHGSSSPHDALARCGTPRDGCRIRWNAPAAPCAGRATSWPAPVKPGAMHDESVTEIRRKAQT